MQDKEYQRQQELHAHRLHTADRKRHRKITERSRKANRPAKANRPHPITVAGWDAGAA